MVPGGGGGVGGGGERRGCTGGPPGSLTTLLWQRRERTYCKNTCILEDIQTKYLKGGNCPKSASNASSPAHVRQLALLHPPKSDEQ